MSALELKNSRLRAAEKNESFIPHRSSAPDRGRHDRQVSSPGPLLRQPASPTTTEPVEGDRWSLSARVKPSLSTGQPMGRGIPTDGEGIAVRSRIAFDLEDRIVSNAGFERGPSI